MVTVAGCYFIHSLSVVYPDTINFPKPEVSYSKLAKVLPLSLVFVFMITFNNLCLKFMDVSFYYVGRSLTVVFNVLFTYAILGQKTSLQAICCCGIVILGFWLGVDQEGEVGTLSITGVIFGALASIFVSLNSIFTKKVRSYPCLTAFYVCLFNICSFIFVLSAKVELNLFSRFSPWSMTTSGH